MDSNTVKNKKNDSSIPSLLIPGILLTALVFLSLMAGSFPLSVRDLLLGDALQINVLCTLRIPRTLTALTGGFTLGVCGYVYQTVFRNPLASPDIIGVSSGACAGAAFGILFLGSRSGITLSAFLGALAAMGGALLLSGVDRTGKKSTIVLAGIAVHALAQTVLMGLKLTADPEQELAAIEYWIMGSLGSISLHRLWPSLPLCLVCLSILFLLHRQTLLLSAEEGEARMLGVDVVRIRALILTLATLAVSAVVSLTGLISFVSLLAPHGARLFRGGNRLSTVFLSGILGGILLTGADILARSLSQTELPVSIFTSLIGAPVLIYLVLGRRQDL